MTMNLTRCGSLVLDFDSDCKLIGIEVTGPASTALRPDVIADATQHR
jgi:hypothetical protein